MINNGYKLLLNDFDRANYLLKILGKQYVEESTQCHDEELLEEMLELNEEIVECENMSELMGIKGQVIENLGILMAEVGDYFKLERYDDAFESLAKWRYLERQIELIDKRKDELTS